VKKPKWNFARLELLEPWFGVQHLPHRCGAGDGPIIIVCLPPERHYKYLEGYLFSLYISSLFIPQLRTQKSQSNQQSCLFQLLPTARHPPIQTSPRTLSPIPKSQIHQRRQTLRPPRLPTQRRKPKKLPIDYMRKELRKNMPREREALDCVWIHEVRFEGL